MRYSLFAACAAAALACAGARPPGGPSDAADAPQGNVVSAPFELSAEQRRAFLRYYAPVLLKRADENTRDHEGVDWVTNAFFDGDENLANNKKNWQENLGAWIDGAGPSSWSPRPTLYTALIEFMDGPRKSVILLYHVYHAMQRNSIHDWERIELRLDGVGEAPGRGEQLAYVVITTHGRHEARHAGGDEAASFYSTAQGHHVLVWQAQWTGALGFHRNELRFVEDDIGRLDRDRHANAKARANLEGGGRTAFHYVFVPRDDAEAVGHFGAEPLTRKNARRLAARRSRWSTPWDDVKRIRYELQDLADLLPTHLDPRSWRKPTEVALSSAVLDEDGLEAIPASPPGESTTFLYQAVDVDDPGERRNGYPRKHWFWGTYYFDRTRLGDGSWTGRWQRSLAGPTPQHDYFAHDGRRSTGGAPEEQAGSGRWLLDRDGWWRSANGGFDGRWVALFPD